MIALTLLNLIMLKQQLQQKLQQKLSPQQIQLIRLLELPALELEERVKHELEDNPALTLTVLTKVAMSWPPTIWREEAKQTPTFPSATI